MKEYDQKTFISGKCVEHYQYSLPISRGFTRKISLGKPNILKEKSQKEKTAFSVNRTRTLIRRLVNTNSQLNKFLTLTSKITEIEKSNRLFNAFIKKMNQHFNNFQYLAIIEFQKDIDFFGRKKEKGGAVHYHLLCNLPFVKSEQLAQIWKHGFIKIKRIDRVNNLGAYVCKYLQKEMFDKRMFKKKKFFCSQNLERPIEILGEESKNFMEKEKNNLKLIREMEFENEYCGKVWRKEFRKIDFKEKNQYAEVNLKQKT